MSAAYDARKVIVAAGGIPLGSFQKDVFLSISYSEDAVTVRKSVQGGVTYSIAAADMAEVTVTVERTSNALKVLSDFFQRQKLTGGGAFPFSVIDNNVPDGLSFFNCPSARIAQMPNQEWAAEAGPIEFRILCGETEHRLDKLPADSVLPL